MKLKTSSNFDLTMQILQNQCYMTFGEAERKARWIFEQINKQRKLGNYNVKVEDYLIEEIDKAREF